jgi:hypothetical protein
MASTMDSVMLGGLVEVQDKQAPLGKPALDDAIPLQQPSRAYNASKEDYRLPSADAPASTSRPQTENDVEMSPPSSPSRPSSLEGLTEVQPTLWNPYMNRYRLVAVCAGNLANALSDGAVGALIPYMET